MLVQLPKTYAQTGYREDPRVFEPERKVIQFIVDFFSSISKVVSATVTQYLFGKTVATSSGTGVNDIWQFDGPIQVSSTSNTIAPALTGYRSRTAGGLAQNDILLYLNATGKDGTNNKWTAGIGFYASEAWGVGTNGTAIQFYTTPNGSASRQISGEIYPSGSWAAGINSISSTSTTGFLYVPAGTGAPTGVPESVTGRCPMYIDKAGSKAYFYDGTNWIALN
jgi:hypothetical protein